MAKSGRRRQVPASRGLFYIALFKLLKGVLLIVAGVGALKLLHQDAGEVALRWINLLRVDPDNRFIHALLGKLLPMDDRELKEISAGTFFYAALLLTEGTGLLMRQHWAEYFTVIATALLIPLEIYELIERVSAVKFVVLGVNAAIVWYLAAKLARDRRESAGPVSEAA